jgi:hypothetical protein
MSEIDHGQHQAEAEARWGETQAYRESARRTRQYTEKDWATLNGQQEAIEAGLAAAMAEGEPPDGQRAMDLAEEARMHIDRWFYPCSPTMHAALAKMYTTDDRFRAHYDDRAEGLAAYVAVAIQANTTRKG